MIELNKKYTGKDLASELFNIANGTFKNDKEGYLEYMSDFFEWHYEGKRFVFTKILKEWVPRPKGRKKTKEQAKEDYGIAIHKLLKVDPWNTGAGIARDITYGNDYIRETYHHKVSTAYSYSRPIVKENYEIIERRWKAYTDGIYIDMSNEDISEWKDLLDKCFSTAKGQDLYEDLAILKDSGDITEEQYKEELAKLNDNKYQAALDMWKMKYGYRPVRVNLYSEKGIEFEEK